MKSLVAQRVIDGCDIKDEIGCGAKNYRRLPSKMKFGTKSHRWLTSRVGLRKVIIALCKTPSLVVEVVMGVHTSGK